MKQKIVLASIAAAVTSVSALWIGGAYYAGKSAQDSLDKQYEWMNNQPYFVVKNRQYQRGWFSSTESATLAINPGMLCFLSEKKAQELSKMELSYSRQIKHGPLPLSSAFHFRPAKAYVHTEILFGPDIQKVLAHAFGDKKPIEIDNLVQFNGGGEIRIKVPSFDYEEAIAGLQLKGPGLEASLKYSSDYNQATLTADLPSLNGVFKGKGDFTLKDLHIGADHQTGKAGLMLGNSKVSLASFALNIGEDSPIKLLLENLAYTGTVSEQGDFIDGGANIKLAKMLLNDKVYGPAELQADASHLHGTTLVKLNNEFGKLQKSNLQCGQLTDEAVKLAKAHGMPLLTHDPHFGIRKLEVKLPDGVLKFSAGLGLKGFQEKDLDTPVTFVSKLSAKADFSVPRKIVETVVMWQARTMLGGTENGVNDADIDYLAGQFVEGQIGRLAEQNLIKVDGDLLSASATLEKGEFTLNDILVPLPWQEVPKKTPPPAKRKR